MCVGDGSCNGWAHPFEHTLHVGDLVLIEGVNASNLNVNYPDSDVIAFYNPAASTEIVFRRIVNSTINGDVFFYAKGDGNAAADWPAVSDSYVHDVWISSNASTPMEPISQDMILGKVVMRVPWVGNVAVFLNDVVGVENRFVSVAFLVLLVVFVMLVLVVPKLLK